MSGTKVHLRDAAFILLLGATVSAGAAGSPRDLLLDSSLSAARRNDACRELRGSREPADRAAFLKALLDTPVRACAAINLREAGAVAELLSALDQADPDVRVSAARELARMRVAAAIPAIARLAEDPNPIVSSSAVMALGEWEDSEAAEALLKVARNGGLTGLSALEAAARRVNSDLVLDVARSYLTVDDIASKVLAMGIIGRLGNASDLVPLREIAASHDSMISRGRGFGFMPPIDLGRIAMNAIAQIEARK